MGERPVSLLAESQRKYLRGERPSKNDSHDRALRSRLRRRVRAGFHDVRLLVEACVEGRVDLTDLLAAERTPNTAGGQSDKDLSADADMPRPWPFAALLFLWAKHNPTLVDAEDLTDVFLKLNTDVSPQTAMDRRTASFDRQVETGVRTAIELGDPGEAIARVENTLDVSVGKDVSELSTEELAELPRRDLDMLFQRGDLDNQQYATIMEQKLSE